MASPCLCKPLMASGPASHVKPVPKQMFGRASPEAAREAAGEALPNGPLAFERHDHLLHGCCLPRNEADACTFDLPSLNRLFQYVLNFSCVIIQCAVI